MNSPRDLDTLASILSERQAQMRNVARIDYLLRDRISDGKEGNTTLKQKLVLALVGALLAVLLIAQLASFYSGFHFGLRHPSPFDCAQGRGARILSGAQRSRRSAPLRSGCLP